MLPTWKLKGSACFLDQQPSMGAGEAEGGTGDVPESWWGC